MGHSQNKNVEEEKKMGHSKILYFQRICKELSSVVRVECSGCGDTELGIKPFWDEKGHWGNKNSTRLMMKDMMS